MTRESFLTDTYNGASVSVGGLLRNFGSMSLVGWTYI